MAKIKTAVKKLQQVETDKRGHKRKASDHGEAVASKVKRVAAPESSFEAMLALGNVNKHPNARGEKPATSYLKELTARETKRKVLPVAAAPTKAVGSKAVGSKAAAVVVSSSGNNNNNSAKLASEKPQSSPGPTPKLSLLEPPPPPPPVQPPSPPKTQQPPQQPPSSQQPPKATKPLLGIKPLSALLKNPPPCSAEATVKTAPNISESAAVPMPPVDRSCHKANVATITQKPAVDSMSNLVAPTSKPKTAPLNHPDVASIQTPVASLADQVVPEPTAIPTSVKTTEPVMSSPVKPSIPVDKQADITPKPMEEGDKKDASETLSPQCKVPEETPKELVEENRPATPVSVEEDISSNTPSSPAEELEESESGVLEETAPESAAKAWATGQPVPCKICKDQSKLYSKNALQAHLRKKHS